MAWEIGRQGNPFNGFKCMHCGENNEKQFRTDGNAILCDTCGWTTDRAGMHPPSAEGLLARTDWQKKHALMCYAQNLYDFIHDIMNHDGNPAVVKPFIRGWLQGFKSKVNCEGAEFQSYLRKMLGKEIRQ